MSDRQEVLNIITDAIATARVDNPDTGEGTTRDNIYQDPDEAAMFAKAIVTALAISGYEILKNDADRT